MSENPYDAPESISIDAKRKPSSRWKTARNISALIFFTAVISWCIWAWLSPFKIPEHPSPAQSWQMKQSLFIVIGAGAIVVSTGLIALTSTIIYAVEKRR